MNENGLHLISWKGNSFVVNRIHTSIKSINYGVPQGSCLLFLIYMNDLPLVIKNATPSIFADNTGLMAASEKLSTA